MSTMSNLNTKYENEFDSFLNLDSNEFTVSGQTSFVNSTPAFSGPSYQYDSHRQQTGLPMGGLANTFAVNQASGLHYRQGGMGFIVPQETLNMPLASNLDDFDYMPDIDYDADSPSDMNVMQGESSQPIPQQRIYPGMHSQQAALAKAAQAQRAQQQQQQQPKQIPGQRPLPTQAPKVKDPVVEESIARVLNRMRQSSSASLDGSTPAPMSGMSGVPKPKKEDDDMDDDERLLASEEGKKLSSKERRQLRNKVSARAFRSRRKEYIGQLEGEVAQKSQEAHDLRVQNQQLMDENKRLTDLTSMLLRSPSFAGFLQELANSGAPAPDLSMNAPQPQPTQTRKDIPTHEAARQLQGHNNQQVGMTMVPETNIELTGLELSNNNWNSLPSNDFQVFAVTELPEPIILDMSGIAEKPVETGRTSNISKDVPQISSLPSTKKTEDVAVQIDETVSLDQDEFALYYDMENTASTPSESANSLIDSLHKPVTQAHEHKERRSESAEIDLEQLCSELEDAFLRLSRYLP